MKHSDINHGENSFGIHLSNKSFSIADNQMSINNSNSIMIGSVLPTPMHSTPSILSTALNASRLNPAVLTKSSSTVTTTINANVVGQLTYINPNNNTIKLVNISKCQQLQNISKDNSNVMTNNAINVQFVTPILNNTSVSTNDSSGASHSVKKLDNSSLNKTSVVLTSVSNSSLTSANSITCTRFILHSSQPQILPHGPVTIIPQHSEVSGGILANNSQLIKNARYTPMGNNHGVDKLKSAKQVPHAIRPITACTASVVSPVSGFPKQSISKISPTKPVNNYTINIPDGKSTIAIQDLSSNRHVAPPKDQPRSMSKTTPITSINYTSNNIRLALTSNITNSKVNFNPSKVQLISPKVRKRSGSPVPVKLDGNSKDLLSGLKDENAENPSCYNSQLDGYSPARKRARKQHLKVDTNNKAHKSGPNPNSTLINSRFIPGDKSISTPVSIAPTISKVVTSIANQIKFDDSNAPICLPNTNPNPQIIIPLKTPIHICTPKSSQNIASIYTNNVSANHSTITSSSNHSTIGNSFNQIQIIAQNSLHCRPVQLSSLSNNLILSPSVAKNFTAFSPQKVIHIAPSKTFNNHHSNQIVKNETMPVDVVNVAFKEEEIQRGAIQSVCDKESLKPEVADVKLEGSSDGLNIKYGLFPYKHNWNARRNHFEKACDVKVKRNKTSSTLRNSNSDNRKDKLSTTEIGISDTSWKLYKASRQLMMQRKFDEENLRLLFKLKDKFHVTPPRNDDDDELVFQRICPNQHHFDPLPDQPTTDSITDFTNPVLFGIADDILPSDINVITTDTRTSQPAEPTSDKDSHQCSESCILYLSEVPAVSQPPQHRRIIDLIEGLIVKETKIIEKESEIHDQCLRLIETSECGPLSSKGNNSKESIVRLLNGRRW